MDVEFLSGIKIYELQSSVIVNPATPIAGRNQVDPEEDEGYKTPTSEEYRIPAPEQRVCPGAPRKRTAASHKDVSSVAKKISRRRAWIRRRESAMLLKMIEVEFSEIIMSAGVNAMD